MRSSAEVESSTDPVWMEKAGGCVHIVLGVFIVPKSSLVLRVASLRGSEGGCAVLVLLENLSTLFFSKVSFLLRYRREQWAPHGATPVSAEVFEREYGWEKDATRVG